MTDLKNCQRQPIPREAEGIILSLRLVRLKCLDETEHEGFWPIQGEGIANDAMRLKAIITHGYANGEIEQCQTRLMNLGSNYEDNTTVSLNREIASFFLPSSGRFPFATNITLLLIEEDYGGINWDEGVKEAIEKIGRIAKSGVSTVVSSGVGGAIGSALGPIGTGVGAAVGALAGLITTGIADAIRSAESDIFPPLDLSMRIDSPDATFEGRHSTRRVEQHEFEGHGGKYLLTYEWRIRHVSTLREPSPGMKYLFHWWNESRQDNHLTSNPHMSGRVGDVLDGYRMYRIEGQVFDPRRPQPEGTIPLFSWWSGDRTDNFITSDPRWGMPVGDIRWNGEHIVNQPSRDGYRLYRLEGFIYDPKLPKPPNTVPLFSWWNGARRDNFATSQRYWSMPLQDIRWRGEHIVGGPVRNGYHLYRLEGYVKR